MTTRLPRQAQPKTALLIKKLSLELIDMVMSHGTELHDGAPPYDPLAPGRNVFTMTLSRVCRDLWYAGARHVWRIVVLRSDGHARRVQDAIEISGGKYGRVGSAIRAIYAKRKRLTRIETYVTIAANCANLHRLEMPLRSFNPMAASNLQCLKTLAILGSRLPKGSKAKAFKAIELAGLKGLKHLTVASTLQIASNCPDPTFSLASLAWEGDYEPEAINWALRKTSGLQILRLYAPPVAFVGRCLARHGKSLLSLRLTYQGTLPSASYTTLFDTLRAQCPRIIEVLLDVCPDPGQMGQLPRSLKHLALKPGAKSSLLEGRTLMDWLNRNATLLVTLWGEHVQKITEAAEGARKLGNNRDLRIHVEAYAEWEQNNRLDFVAENKWPFGDSMAEEYVSFAVPDDRCR